VTSQNPSFDELVSALAPRMLEEAMEQAVVQARNELADRLARALVERALNAPGVALDHDVEDGVAESPRPARPHAQQVGEVGGDARREPPRAMRPARDSGEHVRLDPDAAALYAFAIIPARPVDLAGVPGIDGEAPLRIVQHGDLGLVVSRMHLDLMDDVSEDDLSETGALATLARRHDEVIRSVFEHGPVLPLRFGTVVADDDGARRLLEEQKGSARRRLAHLATHREWGVRLSRDDTGEQQDERADDASARREMTGTAYLASRREALQASQQAEQQTAAMTARAEDALGEHAVDVVRRGGGGPGSALLTDLAYLVPATSEESFLASAERLSGEVAGEGMLLEVTGPWPPYSFASLQHDQPGVVGSA
jgi:Gas vesicle synthesis protein GvpL/GvpF